MSDLHLESQDFKWLLPKGDVLIVAGDLCHAACLSPARRDPYATAQRDRTRRFVDQAAASFQHVVLIAGNHDHYDAIFDDTASLMREHLPAVTVLDDTAVEIGGVSFFGATLWTDLDGRNDASYDRIRRGVGEYFFVKTRDGAAAAGLRKLTPADTLAAHDRSLAALRRHLEIASPRPTVVITHHAPSRLGANPQDAGNGLDGAYVSQLDGLIEGLANVPIWIHGHTHIRKQYRIGATQMLVNCRGFDARDRNTRAFKPDKFFEIGA